MNMALRRCFSGKITESDAFYQLPSVAQALYLHLNMLADDDGFLNNATGVACRLYGGREALKKLVEMRFLLKFGDVYVIKHWRIANSLKNDRRKDLNYRAIAGLIWVKPNRAYTDHPMPGGVNLLELRREQMEEEAGIRNGIQNGKDWNAKRREEKIREDKKRIEKKMEEQWGALCKAYPKERLGNPEHGYSAFCQVVKGEEDVVVLMENLKAWKQSQQWHKDGGRYIPLLCNWLLRGIWKGKPLALGLPMGASGELGEAELEAIRKVLGNSEVSGGMSDGKG